MRLMHARPRQQLVVDGPTLLLPGREDDGGLATADLLRISFSNRRSRPPSPKPSEESGAVSTLMGIAYGTTRSKRGNSTGELREGVSPEPVSI